VAGTDAAPVAAAPNGAAAGAGATQAPPENGANTDKAALDRGVAGLK
jgi:hypothetical protein